MAPTRRTGSRGKKKATGGTLGRVAAAAAAQKGKTQWVRWEDGDVIVLRVLDVKDDFKDAWVHRVPMEKGEGKNVETYYADVPCLDQDDKGIPCPGCKDDLQRRYKFWCNVIVRDWEDESGNEKDTIMVWSGGITVAKRLDKLDSRFGLLNRDLEVAREGSKKNDTKYEVEPYTDEDEPLSDEDKELAKKKFDLSRYYTPPEFDDFYVPPGERDKDDDDDVGNRSVKRGSAFKRRQKEEEEGDDKPRRTASRRRKPAQSKSSNIKGFGKGSSEGSAKKTNTVRRRSSR